MTRRYKLLCPSVCVCVDKLVFDDVITRISRSPDFLCDSLKNSVRYTSDIVVEEITTT